MFTIEIEDAREASLQPKWLKFLKKQSTLLDLNFRIDVSQPEDTEWKLDIKVYFTNHFLKSRVFRFRLKFCQN